MLFTPAFLFLFPAIDPAFPRLTPNQAIAMGLIVEFVGYTSSSSAYWVRGMVALEVARPLLAMTVPVAVAFSLVAFAVPPRSLLLLFGGILFLLAVLLVWRHRGGGHGVGPPPGDPLGGPGGAPAAAVSGEGARRHVDRDGRAFQFRFQTTWIDRLIAAVAGGFAGLTGIGAGPIVTTLLYGRHAVPIHLAAATSIFVVAVTVLSAAVSHALLLVRRDVGLPWALVGTMALAVLVGGQFAPRLARRIPERAMRAALIGMFLFVGALMVLRGLRM